MWQRSDAPRGFRKLTLWSCVMSMLWSCDHTKDHEWPRPHQAQNNQCAWTWSVCSTRGIFSVNGEDTSSSVSYWTHTQAENWSANPLWIGLHCLTKHSLPLCVWWVRVRINFILYTLSLSLSLWSSSCLGLSGVSLLKEEFKLLLGSEFTQMTPGLTLIFSSCCWWEGSFKTAGTSLVSQLLRYLMNLIWYI